VRSGADGSQFSGSGHIDISLAREKAVVSR
jgi:hypothetical protein